jgi:hypothetical protein
LDFSLLAIETLQSHFVFLFFISLFGKILPLKKPAPPSSCTNFCERERERERERRGRDPLLEVAADLSEVFNIKSVLTRLAIFLPQLRKIEEDKG